jgi:hypothetical protein
MTKRHRAAVAAQCRFSGGRSSSRRKATEAVRERSRGTRRYLSGQLHRRVTSSAGPRLPSRSAGSSAGWRRRRFCPGGRRHERPSGRRSDRTPSRARRPTDARAVIARLPRAHPRCGTRCALGVCGERLAPWRFSRRSVGVGVSVCLWGRCRPQAALPLCSEGPPL